MILAKKGAKSTDDILYDRFQSAAPISCSKISGAIIDPNSKPNLTFVRLRKGMKLCHEICFKILAAVEELFFCIVHVDPMIWRYINNFGQNFRVI
jgi:hypothetical protein